MYKAVVRLLELLEIEHRITHLRGTGKRFVSWLRVIFVKKFSRVHFLKNKEFKNLLYMHSLEYPKIYFNKAQTLMAANIIRAANSNVQR